MEYHEGLIAYYEEQAAEEEYVDKIIGRFKAARLSSHYQYNRDVSIPAQIFLSKAKALAGVDETSAFILAYAASEYTIKKVLLESVVAGLLHNEELEEVITPIVLKNGGFIKILFNILNTLGLNVQEKKVPHTKRSIKQEWDYLKPLRDGSVHRCELRTLEETERAIVLAECLLGEVLTDFVKLLQVEEHET